MASRRAHAQERRKDRRIPVVARVRIEARDPVALVQADLVDVSAGGLRARTDDPGLTLAEGREVTVEITVQDAADERHPPLVNLQGRGRVVRVEGAAGAPRSIALAFTGSLTVLEPFAQMLLF